MVKALIRDMILCLEEHELQEVYLLSSRRVVLEAVCFNQDTIDVDNGDTRLFIVLSAREI